MGSRSEKTAGTHPLARQRAGGRGGGRSRPVHRPASRGRGSDPDRGRGGRGRGGRGAAHARRGPERWPRAHRARAADPGAADGCHERVAPEAQGEPHLPRARGQPHGRGAAWRRCRRLLPVRGLRERPGGGREPGDGGLLGQRVPGTRHAPGGGAPGPAARWPAGAGPRPRAPDGAHGLGGGGGHRQGRLHRGQGVLPRGHPVRPRSRARAGRAPLRHGGGDADPGRRRAGGGGLRRCVRAQCVATARCTRRGARHPAPLP